MREFVVVGHEAPTTPDVPLDDLPGSAGRLDLLARCVTAALLVSHGIRESVRAHLVLGDQFTVSFDGESLRGLHPDERSTAAQIRTALEHGETAVGARAVDVSPGVTIRRRGFEESVRAAAERGAVVQLHEDGAPLVDVVPVEHPVLVLSDHLDFMDGEVEVLEAVADERCRLGPERLHADHAISVAHNLLDTAGCREF